MDWRDSIGTTASKRDANRPPTTLEFCSNQLDFLGEPLEIIGQSLAFVRRTRVAAAVPANLAAIWDMDIQGYVLVRRDARETARLVSLSYPFMKLGRRRIAGVAGYRGSQQFWIIFPHWAPLQPNLGTHIDMDHLCRAVSP